MLLHVPNQRYKRLKIKNGQNDLSGNSSVKACICVCSLQIDLMDHFLEINVSIYY